MVDRRSFIRSCALPTMGFALPYGAASATPRAPAARSSPSPGEGCLGVHDVTAYGAAGDGETDDTEALQSALSAAGATRTNNAVGATVFLPPGEYRFSETLVVPGRVQLIGSGVFASMLECTCPDVDAVHLEDEADRTAIRRLTVRYDADGQGTCLRLRGENHNCAFEDLHLARGDIGLHATGAWMSRFTNVRVNASAGDGFRFEGGYSTLLLENCYVTGGREGFHFRGAKASLMSCAADNMTECAYRLRNTQILAQTCFSEGKDYQGDHPAVWVFEGDVQATIRGFRANGLRTSDGSVVEIFRLDTTSGPVDVDVRQLVVSEIQPDTDVRLYGVVPGNETRSRISFESPQVPEEVRSGRPRGASVQRRSMSGAQAVSYASGDEPVYRSFVEPGPQPTYEIRADGSMRWGNGEEATDTSLGRSRPSELHVDGALHIGGRNQGWLQLPCYRRSQRPDPGRPGRVIFNSDDGVINVDDGDGWRKPDGSPA